MRFLLILFVFINQVSAWEIIHEKDSVFIQDENLKEKEEIIAHPEIKKMETKKLSEDITLITYLENLGGTTSPSESYNCAAFSKKLKKLLFKDLACKTILSFEGGRKEIDEAVFKIEGEHLNYSFLELKRKFDLPK